MRQLATSVGPDLDAVVEILEAREDGAADEVLFEEVEDSFGFSLSVRIPHATEKGLEAVVAREVEEPRVPDRLAVAADATQDDRRHVIEDHPLGDALKRFESAREPFEERALALVTVEADVELAGVGEDAAEAMDALGRIGDRDGVDGPVDLHLLSGWSLETALDRFPRSQRPVEGADVFGQDRATAGEAQGADLAQDAGGGQTLLDPLVDRFAERIEFRRRGGRRRRVVAFLAEDASDGLAIEQDAAGNLPGAIALLVEVENLAALLRGCLRSVGW